MFRRRVRMENRNMTEKFARDDLAMHKLDERHTHAARSAPSRGNGANAGPYTLLKAALESGIRWPAPDQGKRADEIHSAAAHAAGGWRTISNGEHFVTLKRHENG